MTEEVKEFVAKTNAGLEPVLAKELMALGCKVEEGYRAVTFYATEEQLYKANIWCRTAVKILTPIFSFQARDENGLYKNIKSFAWEDIIDGRKTISVESVASSVIFKHSKYVSYKVKDAIVDRFRELTGKRPNVDVQAADYNIHIYIQNEKVNVSLDTSGKPLFMRGYRAKGGEAPLNEILAAGMILLTGYNGDRPFLDLMCGSGTLPIEAAMIAQNIAPGLVTERTFGFQNWKTYNHELFEKVKKEALEQVRPLKFPIIAKDISPTALRTARLNAGQAGVVSGIKFEIEDFFDCNPSVENGTIVINPPYGERVKVENLNEFYRKISDKLKKDFSGFEAWIISSNAEALKNFDLKPSQKHRLFNGPTECSFRKYELFKGAYKEKKSLEETK